jgi:hypothetical protein
MFSLPVGSDLSDGFEICYCYSNCSWIVQSVVAIFVTGHNPFRRVRPMPRNSTTVSASCVTDVKAVVASNHAVLAWGHVLHFDATNGVVVRLWRPEPFKGVRRAPIPTARWALSTAAESVPGGPAKLLPLTTDPSGRHCVVEVGWGGIIQYQLLLKVVVYN